MKLLALILSIYLLGLNAIPCGDAIDTSEETSISSKDDHGQDKLVDFCSPFCQCHCCHVHVTDFRNAKLSEVIPQIPTHLKKNIHETGIELSSFHFQPPRL